MGGRAGPARALAVDCAAISVGDQAGMQEDYDRYFVIISESDLLKGLSSFIIHRELLSAMGELKSEKVKKWNYTKVTVVPYTTLNFCKGVISSRDLYVCTDEEIWLKRIVSRENGNNIETNSFILTFRKDRIPDSIKAGYLSLRVRQYILNSMKCYQCQRFGHVSINCTYAPTCSSSGKNEHGENECSPPPHCVNYGQKHSPRRRECLVYKEKFSIQRIKVQEKISYFMTRNLAKQQKEKHR
ncbi:uncharacterized protein LOC143190856 [Rhynchophorus ferrugineus]|uniref:uncharacterized protein LOC143190856 n=1 Tax=Rhynchophorus ferrugineus TaxID=354439 RepID=UPI003FCCDC7E